LKKIKVTEVFECIKILKIFEMNDPKLRDKCLKEVRLMQVYLKRKNNFTVT
jgi:hypothetical protein